MAYKAITEAGTRQDTLAKYFQNEIRLKDEKALKALLKTADGRWFLMRLFDMTEINADTFTGNSQTFYKEGKRRIGVELLRQIAAMGIEGIKLKQRAELEYIEYQEKARKIAEDYADREELL